MKMGNEKKDTRKRKIVDFWKLLGIPFEHDSSYYWQAVLDIGRGCLIKTAAKENNLGSSFEQA